MRLVEGLELMKNIYNELTQITSRPRPFQNYNAKKLWADEHISKQMLAFHLDPTNDIASRRASLINKVVAFLTAKLKIRPGSSLIDYGCGPGLYCHRFAKAGVKVTGVDFSERSLKYARAQARKARLNINYIEANYLQFKAKGPFDVATLIYQDFCALPPSQRKVLLASIRRSLTNDGFLVFDVYLKTAFKQRQEGTQFKKNLQGGFWSARKYYEFLQTFVYRKECVLLDKYTIIERNGIKTVYNWLEYFDLAKLKKELAASGFRVVNAYADLTGRALNKTSHEMAVIVRKAR